MYICNTVKKYKEVLSQWLTNIWEIELFSEKCLCSGVTQRLERCWKKGRAGHVSDKGYSVFRRYLKITFTIQQNTLLVCQHETTPAALARSQKLYLSACDTLWTTTHKHSWSELLLGILPPASAGLTWVLLILNHMLVTAIIWVKEKKKIPEYKLEWIQFSCDCVLFIVCFIDFSTDTLYSVFCKYHQQHNLSLLRWECKNFLMLMALLIICFFFLLFSERYKAQSIIAWEHCESH